MSITIVDDDSKSTDSLRILVHGKAGELLQYANKDHSEFCLYHNRRGVLNFEQPLSSQGVQNEDRLISFRIICL